MCRWRKKLLVVAENTANSEEECLFASPYISLTPGHVNIDFMEVPYALWRIVRQLRVAFTLIGPSLGALDFERGNGNSQLFKSSLILLLLLFVLLRCHRKPGTTLYWEPYGYGSSPDHRLHKHATLTHDLHWTWFSLPNAHTPKRIIWPICRLLRLIWTTPALDSACPIVPAGIGSGFPAAFH